MTITDFLETNQSLMNDFIKMSHNAANRPDYIQGGGGNTSVKLSGALMAIKASGYSMGQIKADNAYAVLDLALLNDFYNNTNPSELSDIEEIGSAKTKESTISVEGLPSLRPSVEAGFHSILDKFVLHSHAVYSNLLGCTKEGSLLLSNALEGADYTFAFVPYVNPGSTLTFCIRDIINKTIAKTGISPQLLLMENHGVIAHADNYQRAEEIHHDANQRFAKFFKTDKSDFPIITIKGKDQEWRSSTPWLTEKLVTGKYSSSFFMEQALYPDQLVFLAGNLEYVDEFPNQLSKKCTIKNSTGEIRYNCSESEALVIEQTLVCSIFIVETIEKAGLTLQPMDTSGKSFIAGWESEAYRQSLLK